MKTIRAISKFHNFSPKGSVLSHDFLIKLLINSSRRLSLTATSIRYYTNLLNSSSLYSFLCIWCIIDEHIEKTANAVTSFKNTKQFQINKLFIDLFIFPKNICVLSSYQFLIFQNSFQVNSAKIFMLRNPSKLRSLCQIKRPLHIIFSHGDYQITVHSW